jgi:DNA polymerase-2
MTLHGPEPADARESPVDYAHYLDRQIAPVADGMLHFLDTSLAAITDRQLELF